MHDQLLSSSPVHKQAVSGNARTTDPALAGIASTELWLTAVGDDLRPQGTPFGAHAHDVSEDDHLTVVHATPLGTPFVVVTMSLAGGKEADLLFKVVKTERLRRQQCTTCALVCRLNREV